MRRNRDKANNADPKQIAQAALAVIDRLQAFHPQLQPMAAAAVMLLLSDRLKMSAQDLFTLTKNIMNSKHGLRFEFAAIRDYLKYEIKD